MSFTPHLIPTCGCAPPHLGPRLPRPCNANIISSTSPLGVFQCILAFKHETPTFQSSLQSRDVFQLHLDVFSCISVFIRTGADAGFFKGGGSNFGVQAGGCVQSGKGRGPALGPMLQSLHGESKRVVSGPLPTGSAQAVKTRGVSHKDESQDTPNSLKIFYPCPWGYNIRILKQNPHF